MPIIKNILEVPSIEGFTTSIEEHTSINTHIGNISILENGDNIITSFTTTNNVNFDINSSGAIYTKSTYSYATKRSYSFNVYATNSAGDSNITVVKIDINVPPKAEFGEALFDITKLNDETYLIWDTDKFE